MRLGQQVLSKIQNLLTHIDKKVKPRPNKRIPKQNRDSNSSFVKLHNDHRVKLQKIQEKVAEKQSIQRMECSPFKVTNKHSLFLNSQRAKSPIYQRIQQLQAEKFQEMLKLKQKYPPKVTENEQQFADLFDQQEFYQRKKNQKKYSKKQLQEKLHQLQKKEKQRLQRINMLKIKSIQEHSKDYRCKPYVNKGSEKIWAGYRLKKQLSSSVFQRFQQYQIQRKTNLQKIEKRVKNEVTPFNPKISSHSRFLASRSSSRSNLHKKIQRSVSCKCFQRTNAKLQNTSTALHSSRKY